MINDIVVVCRNVTYGRVLTCWWSSRVWRILTLHNRSKTRFAFLVFTHNFVKGSLQVISK